MKDKENNEVLKIVLIGEASVGKTSIIYQFIDKIFQEDLQSTIGGTFNSKSIKCNNNKTLNLEIWDTAGQEQYRSINNLFYKDAYICLLVYDITNKITFNCLKDYWYEAVYQNGRKGIIFGVAGNKNDLYEEEDIAESEVQEFCNSIDACFKLTSAKINTSIDDIFLMLGEKFVKSDFMKELMPQYVKEDNESEGQKSNNGSIKLKRQDISNTSSDENDIDSNNNNKFLSKGNICC